MQRGNAIGKDLGGIIAIALGDVLWMNKNLRFVAGPCLNILIPYVFFPLRVSFPPHRAGRRLLNRHEVTLKKKKKCRL